MHRQTNINGKEGDDDHSAANSQESGREPADEEEYQGGVDASIILEDGSCPVN